jgi:proline iminopeptidase
MKKLFLVFIFLFTGLLSWAQDIYTQSFGKSTDTPVIFLHGGPGGTSIDFEITTAQNLADKGFFVILYDRRGEGRSDESRAKYTFEQTFADLNAIYSKYNLQSASLLGHSFGGIVAAKFATENPLKVKNIVLTGTPVNLQMSFTAILNTVENIVEAKKDSAALTQLNFVKKQDTSSIYYSSGSFMLAMQNGLYNSKSPDSSATEYYSALMKSDKAKDYFQSLAKNNYKKMYDSSMGFFNNEKYTTIDLIPAFNMIKDIPVYGIYGKEDGLFDQKQIAIVKALTKDFVYLNNCSHNVFMDQQTEFINALLGWLK